MGVLFICEVVLHVFMEEFEYVCGSGDDKVELEGMEFWLADAVGCVPGMLFDGVWDPGGDSLPLNCSCNSSNLLHNSVLLCVVLVTLLYNCWHCSSSL